MPGRVLELTFKENRLIRQPRRGWFHQLLVDIEGSICQEILKEKIEGVSPIIPHKIAQW
jgi:hypothetical protein